MINITQIIQAAAPIFYNVVGWLYESLKDGEIQDYDWTKLGQSTLRIVLITALGAGTLASFGIDVDIFSSTVGATLVEFIIKQIENWRRDKILSSVGYY